MKLGSLFDGSGGFPLAGALCGVEPVWASEIEPYPIRVTTRRFPRMKHLGDITKINGAEIEPVDVITFGSPCQDLSVAGKRAGIHDGARSSLFFHAVRIMKEMREATNGLYPRIVIWENVHGAFSSNKGEDFRAVLQALCEIAEQGAYVPRPEKGKWGGCRHYLGRWLQRCLAYVRCSVLGSHHQKWRYRRCATGWDPTTSETHLPCRRS